MKKKGRDARASTPSARRTHAAARAAATAAAAVGVGAARRDHDGERGARRADQRLCMLLLLLRGRGEEWRRLVVSQQVSD